MQRTTFEKLNKHWRIRFGARAWICLWKNCGDHYCWTKIRSSSSGSSIMASSIIEEPRSGVSTLGLALSIIINRKQLSTYSLVAGSFVDVGLLLSSWQAHLFPLFSMKVLYGVFYMLELWGCVAPPHSHHRCDAPKHLDWAQRHPVSRLKIIFAYQRGFEIDSSPCPSVDGTFL